MSWRQRDRDRPDGRRGGGGRASAAAAAPAATTPAALLAEAETLQQRAERRGGAEALALHEQAAAAYRAALDGGGGLTGEQRADAAFGLAECLQSAADLQLQLLRAAPDEQLAAGLAAAVRPAAAARFQEAVAAYEQVPPEAGSSAALPMRNDACVNAANTLCSWAELCGDGDDSTQQQQRRQLLARAVQLYRAALAAEGSSGGDADDADTLSNLGDALVAQGEAACQAGQAAEGQAAFEAAVAAYERSCGLSDSSAGDDLPSLLHNWGVGLHAIAKHATDAQLRRSLLEQAAAKLRAAADFGRGDPAPHNALGDVLVAAAEEELAAAAGGSAEAAAAAAAGPLPPDVAQRAAALFCQARDDGYAAALTLVRTNADALLGLGEAAVALGKLARRQGDAAAAARFFSDGAAHYAAALARPQLLGDAEERADARYNAACAAALAGRPDAAQPLLEALAAAGRLSAGELAADDDLAGLRAGGGAAGAGWLDGLLQRLRQQQQQQR